jgi:ribosome maturation factor RimP
VECGVSVSTENEIVDQGGPGSGEKGPLWRVIEPLVREAGLELFDLEAPPSGRGTLRVFIWRPGGEAALSKDSAHLKDGAHLKGVGIDDCVRISKRITNLENVDEVLPGDWLIEVSSPGVNRKLKRPEHFAGAVGERVKLTVAGADGRNEVLTGVLVGFDGTVVELDVEAEKQKEPVARRAVPFGRVQNARVDFLFSER